MIRSSLRARVAHISRSLRRRAWLPAVVFLAAVCLAALALVALPLRAPWLPGGAARAAELQIEAPRFSFDQAANTYTYEDGRLSLGELSLFASHMELNATTGKVSASGFIRIQTPDVTGVAESMELDATSRVGTFHGADLYVSQGGIYLRAREVTIRPDGRLIVRHCSLTTCTPDVPGAWSIAASTLDLRPDGVSIAWNPRLYLGPVPVLWLPIMAWPTVHERRSGVLLPHISRDTSSLKRFDLGWRVGIPVFMDLGYNQDLTFTPESIQNRGVALGFEYNYAFWENQFGRITLWGINERTPRVPGEEDDLLTLQGLTPPKDALSRYREDWLHNQALTDATRLILSYHNSSDGQVRREYDGVSEYRPYQTYQASVTGQWPWADAALTYEQNADYREESVYAIGRSYTDVDLRPQLLPRLTTQFGGRLFDAVPLTLGVGLSATRFVAPHDVSGTLAEASPTLSLPIALGGSFELRPSVTRHFVTYASLTQYNAGNPDTVLPDQSFAQTEGTLELRGAFARVFSLEGGRYGALKHRVVPRLVLTGVQDVPQPFSDHVLRARVAERLVTLRVDNDLLAKPRAAMAGPAGAYGGPSEGSARAAGDEGPVRELLHANLIQRYNLLLRRDAPALQGPTPSRREETLPGEPLLPLLLEIGATGSQYSANALVNYHYQLRRATRTEVSVQGSAGPRTALGVGYTFNEFTFVSPEDKVVPQANAFTFSGAVDWSDAWGMGFSGRINLTDGPAPLQRRIDRDEVYVEYRPVCYALRFSYAEQVNSTLENGTEKFFVDRHFSVSFDLVGLVGGPLQAAPLPGLPAASYGSTPSTAAAHGSVPAHCRI
jgi:hypothetical protein